MHIRLHGSLAMGALLCALRVGSAGAVESNAAQESPQATARLLALTRTLQDTFAAAGNALREQLQQSALAHPVAAARAGRSALHQRARVLQLQRRLAALAPAASATAMLDAPLDPFNRARLPHHRSPFDAGELLTGLTTPNEFSGRAYPSTADRYRAHPLTTDEGMGPVSVSAHRSSARSWGMYRGEADGLARSVPALPLDSEPAAHALNRP